MTSSWDRKSSYDMHPERWLIVPRLMFVPPVVSEKLKHTHTHTHTLTERIAVYRIVAKNNIISALTSSWRAIILLLTSTIDHKDERAILISTTAHEKNRLTCVWEQKQMVLKWLFMLWSQPKSLRKSSSQFVLLQWLQHQTAGEWQYYFEFGKKGDKISPFKTSACMGFY